MAKVIYFYIMQRKKSYSLTPSAKKMIYLEMHPKDSLV